MVKKRNLLFLVVALFLFLSMVYYPTSLFGQLGAVMMLIAILYFVLRFFWNALKALV